MNTNILGDKMLTNAQIARKVVAASKRWLKENGYADVMVHCIRGTYHVTNANNYMMSAKYILESATGLPFMPLNSCMAQIIYTNS
jgi:hypothetical protein